MLTTLAMIIPSAFVFLFALQPPLDLDLGWHLRYGEFFFTTGHVLKDNIISYIWPHYQWVQASWGYDLLVYQLFTRFGFLGLSIAGAIITLAIFIVVTYPQRRFNFFQLFFLAAVFLTQSTPLYSTGIRSQTPSTLMFAFLLVLLHRFLTSGGRVYLVLPFLFLLWANLHGGFALGLIVAIVVWAGYGGLLLTQKMTRKSLTPVSLKRWVILGITLLFSSLATLLNPWGVRIYEETFKHGSNVNLTMISEWMPLTNWRTESIILISLALLAIFIAAVGKKLITYLPYLLSLVLVAMLALSAVRFTIVFGLMLTFYLALLLPDIPPLPHRYKMLIPVLKFLPILLVLLDLFFTHRYLFFPNPKIFNYTWYDYCNSANDCSEEIGKLMAADPPKGNGYNTYNFGGYLAWRVPQVKTFMDGRMAAWMEGNQTPPVADIDQAFVDTTPITFRRLDSQYHFGWVIIPTQSAAANYLNELTKSGRWERRYTDSCYSYYVKEN